MEAFKATLEELRFADVLLHVIDLSNPEWEEQAEVVDRLVRQLGAEQTPCLRVFNKCDLYVGILPHGDDVVCISAKTGEGADVLTERLSAMLRDGVRETELLLPYSDAGVLDVLRREAQLLSADYEDLGIRVRAELTPELRGRYRQFIPGWTEPHEDWE